MRAVLAAALLFLVVVLILGLAKVRARLMDDHRDLETMDEFHRWRYYR